MDNAYIYPMFTSIKHFIGRIVYVSHYTYDAISIHLLR